MRAPGIISKGLSSISAAAAQETRRTWRGATA